MKLQNELLWSHNASELERSIQEIFEDLPVENLIDVKFCVTHSFSHESDSVTKYSALVIYKK